MAAPSPPVAPAVPLRGPEPHIARVSSERLFAGASELQINHRGVIYRLKQTAMGKLILTK